MFKIEHVQYSMLNYSFNLSYYLSEDTVFVINKFLRPKRIAYKEHGVMSIIQTHYRDIVT